MAVQGLLRDGALKNLSSPSYLSLPQLNPLSIPSIMSPFMPSLRALYKTALTYSQFALLSSSNTVSGGSPETCSNPQISCQNTSAVADTCCFNAPGGQLLQVRQDAQHLHAQIPTHSFPADSILGRRPFHWTSRFLDHSRPMVGTTVLSHLLVSNHQQARPLRRNLRFQLRCVARLYQHHRHPDRRRPKLPPLIHGYLLGQRLGYKRGFLGA